MAAASKSHVDEQKSDFDDLKEVFPSCESSQIKPPASACLIGDKYRHRLKSVQILLSRAQAGPDRKVKQQQVAGRNYLQPRTIFLADLCTFARLRGYQMRDSRNSCPIEVLLYLNKPLIILQT